VPPLASQQPPELVQTALTVLALAGLAVWAFVAVRLARRQPVVPHEPRRPVPWTLPDLLSILLIYLVLQMGVLAAAWVWLGAEALEPPTAYRVEQATTEHAVSQLLERARADVVVFLLCGFTAVVAAPIAEEFLYRLLLQGWLERFWAELGPRMPRLRRLLPGGTLPIVLVALLFARAHFRVPSAPRDPGLQLFLLVGVGVGSLLTVAAAVLLLRVRVGATWADLGWDLGKLPRDAAVGVLAFCAVGAPLYALQTTLSGVLPKHVSPDALTLLPFALLLGLLYYRTHRLGPPLALHMALNATTLLMAWLAIVGE